ncbi:MAG: DedA family protein [Thaumarchaeota archaeon]|nr:DedA family protein [Nitrososphaerota archaeon]
MNEVQALIQWISSLVSEYLYVGVFIAAIIETVFPPIPTAAIFPFAGYFASQNGMSVIEVFGLGISGGAGATIGSTVIYLVCIKLGRVAMLRYLKYARISEQKLARIETWFERHGEKAVFFGRMVPVLREMISIPAGLFKMSPIKFVLYTFCGSCVWSIALTFVGYYFGQVTLGII